MCVCAYVYVCVCARAHTCMLVRVFVLYIFSFHTNPCHTLFGDEMSVELIQFAVSNSKIPRECEYKTRFLEKKET